VVTKLSRAAAMCVVLSLAAVACTSSGGSPVAAPSPSSVHSDPLLLVGQWFLDAEGEAAGSAIALGQGLTLFLSCGVLDGEWRADGGQSLFVAYSSGGDGPCFDGNQRHPMPWLDQAVAFRIDGDNRRLLDQDGKTVALLRPGAKPTVGPNRSKDFYETPPTISAAMRAAAEEPQPVPADATPVTQAQLLRRWVPSGLDPSSPAQLTFQADGVWSGSDGCNGQGGRYVLGRDGRLLSVSGSSTLVGCRGAPVGGWMSQATRAALSHGDLLLYDQSAQVLGEPHPVSD
jgi:hypothetical protein